MNIRSKWLNNIFAVKPQKSSQNKNRATLPLESPYRFVGNVLLLGMVFAAACGIVTIRDDLINKKFDNIMGMFFKSSVDYGWSIDDILINGRTKTNFADLQQVMELSLILICLKYGLSSFITTPGMPPSRTNRLEPPPITLNGKLCGRLIKKWRKSSISAGIYITSAGPPSPNHVCFDIGTCFKYFPRTSGKISVIDL